MIQIRTIIYGLCFFFYCPAMAQVEFSVALKRKPPCAPATKLELQLTAEIEPGWHISSISQPDGGPARTGIKVTPETLFKIGSIGAPAPRKELSTAFDMEVETYTGSVVFTLPLVATEDIKPGTKLSVEVTYQACNDETCLLPKTETVSCIIGDVAQQREDGCTKGAAPKQSEGVTDAGAPRALKEHTKPEAGNGKDKPSEKP